MAYMNANVLDVEQSEAVDERIHEFRTSKQHAVEVGHGCSALGASIAASLSGNHGPLAHMRGIEDLLEIVQCLHEALRDNKAPQLTVYLQNRLDESFDQIVCEVEREAEEAEANELARELSEQENRAPLGAPEFN